MAAAIRRALAEEEGDILAFLPGVGEIERTAERLEGIPVQLHRLHGSLDPADQQAALRKSGNRKVILATAIAETSLTIDGVRIIVDSGLARRARYDRAAGVARLVTERVSQAAATQRAGRAARQQPGIAYRLWEKAATAGLPPYDPPEILEADLSPLLLDCALWGVTDPMQLAWLDPPPAAALAEARARLTALGALDGNGRPTAHGRAVAGLPLPPRLAHMLLTAAASGAASLAAEAAMLLSERGLGGQDADLDARLTRWRRERGPRAEAARRLAQRLEKMATASSQAGPERDLDLAAIIALGFPDRLAKRRDARGENWISVGGRGFRLDPTSPLARADWLAVADIQGAASGARIMSAVPIDRAQVDALFADQIESGTRLSFDPATGGVRAESGRHLGAITLAKGQDSTASPEAIAQALLEAVRTHGLTILPWPPSVDRLRTRAHWAGLDAVTDTALLASLDLWLAPLLTGKRRLSDIDEGAWGNALRGLMGWDGQQMLDRLAPANFTSPAGTTHPIDYAADGGPMVELRVQALFGVSDHPVIGPDRVPLILSLTSPAGRPIQTTRDLPGFWAGSWRDVAKEMRGAYPKHNWPDDPASATASLKTKKAQARH
jgi:ATP-dependent helicase HrpB